MDFFTEFQSEWPADKPTPKVDQGCVDQGNNEFEDDTIEEEGSEQLPLDLACCAH